MGPACPPRGAAGLTPSGHCTGHAAVPAQLRRWEEAGGGWPTGRFGPQALSWPAPVHVSWWHGFCGLREAVQSPGSEPANTILLLAAFLPLCVERNPSQRPSLPAHILSTALQDWCGRPCTLKPVARRSEFPGHPHNGPVHLVVHLHPGGTGARTLRSSVPPCSACISLPGPPQSFSPCTSCLPLGGPGDIPGVNQLSHMGNGGDSCYNAPRSVV